MKAIYFEQGQLIVDEQPSPMIRKDEVKIQMKAASLNRRDLFNLEKLGNNSEAIILGSDASGIIEQVGEEVKEWAIGDEVIINPSLRWFQNTDFPPNDFEVLSLPDQGTFSEKIVISAEQLERKPGYLTYEEAATIGIAPVTAYRALVTKGQIKAGQTVFIPGAGSGVATFMIQFARHLGARVIVSSRSEVKRQQALHIGANLAIDSNGIWVELLKEEKIDLVIDSVGKETFTRALDVLKKGGTLVTFGATTESVVSIDLRELFFGQFSIHGTTMGSREEFRACLQLMTKYEIHPVIDAIYQMDDAHKAIERLQLNEQFGKIVITM